MLNSKQFVKENNRRPYGLCQVYLTSFLLVAETIAYPKPIYNISKFPTTLNIRNVEIHSTEN